jgi:hypothetical protein
MKNLFVSHNIHQIYNHSSPAGMLTKRSSVVATPDSLIYTTRVSDPRGDTI